MKKTFYVFAALLAGFAMVACDKDDNGGGGGGPKPDYSVTYEREGYDASGLAYYLVDGEISKITYSYMAGKDKPASIDYAVVYEPNKCTVSYTSKNLGGEVNLVYTLNADGFATGGSQILKGDGVSEDYEMAISAYTYNPDKMLAKIEMDGEEAFAATYEGTELKSITSPDGGAMDVVSSTILNDSKVDPLYSFLFGIVANPDASLEQMAVACGLLPQSKYLPEKLIAEMEEEDEDGGVVTETIELPIISSVSGGKLTKVTFGDLSLVYNYK